VVDTLPMAVCKLLAEALLAENGARILKKGRNTTHGFYIDPTQLT